MLGSLSLLKDVPYSIYATFFDLAKTPGKPVVNALEILDYTLAGKVNLNQPVNLYALDYMFSKYLDMNIKKTVPIIFTEDDEELKQAYQKGNVCIGNRCTALIVKDAYKSILDSDELDYTIQELKKMEQQLLIYENVSIFEMLIGAKRGIKASVMGLKQLCEKYEALAEHVKVLLSTGTDLEEVLRGYMLC